MRVEPVVRRREIVEVGDVLPLGRGDDRVAVAIDRAGDLRERLAALAPKDDLEERDVALADARDVDARVVAEDLRPERRHVRPADDDGGARTFRPDEIRDQPDTAPV